MFEESKVAADKKQTVPNHFKYSILISLIMISTKVLQLLPVQLIRKLPSSTFSDIPRALFKAGA
jgi:hypothetical protein